MKILHVISSGGMYGAEAVILNLCRALNRRGHRSVLGVFSNSANPNVELYEYARNNDIDAHLMTCKGRLDPGTVARIRELLAQTGADVVHAHGYKADLYACFALRGSNVALVSTCHNWLDNDLMVWLYGIADRFVLKKYARVVAVSGEAKRRLLKSGVREGNIRTIRNAIELAPFDGARPSRRGQGGHQPPMVGLVGRLSKEKGIDVFLRAAAEVLLQCPETKFVVAGEGPERGVLEGLIETLKIRPSVSMLGRRDDMPAVYASLDVMVLSSRMEGLPMALLEAMASSLAVIATPVGEVPSLISNGHTGVLVPVDDAHVLAGAIVELLRDPQQRRRLGTAARQRMERDFYAERMTADYLCVYEEAITAVTAHRQGSDERQ